MPVSTQAAKKIDIKPAVRTRKIASTKISPDVLAAQLESTLVVSDRNAKVRTTTSANGTGKQRTDLSHQLKTSAMRAVNDASQSLSSVAELGWRASAETLKRKSSTYTGVLNSIAAASKALRDMRVFCPNEIDTERAASSIITKLITLELFDSAIDMLKSTRSHLLSFYCPTSADILSDQLQLMSLPLPTSESQALDPSLCALISTYFVQSLTAISHLISQTSTSITIDSLASGLLTAPSLLSWLPHLASLSAKQRDALLIRAYTILTALCVSLGDRALPRPAFTVRMYALRCVVCAGLRDEKTNAVWDQAVRFAVVFLRAYPSTDSNALAAKSGSAEGHGCSEKEAVELVSQTFDELLSFVAEQSTSKLGSPLSPPFGGNAFIGFCDYWLRLARQIGDLPLLDRITSLLHNHPGASSCQSPTSPPVDKLAAQMSDMTLGSAKLTMSAERELDNYFLLASTQICAVLSGATAAIELGKSMEDICKRMRDVGSVIPQCASLLCHSEPKTLDSSEISTPPTHSNSTIAERTADCQALSRAQDKVDRALERFRRSAVKLLDDTSGTGKNISAWGGQKRDIMHILREIVDLFKQILLKRLNADALTSALDTSFALARHTLVGVDPDTYVPSVNILIHAVELVDAFTAPDNDSSTSQTLSSTSTVVGGETSSSSSLEQQPSVLFSARANYIRCISGAFYNLAGRLYQESRYAGAVRFLREACALGQRALEMQASFNADGGSERGTKDKDGWNQLEEQLYRRWELLGLCYTKMGERQLAHTAFVESVRTFPYERFSFTMQFQTHGPNTLFRAAPEFKQLGAVVDKLTYIGACELYLDSSALSLKEKLQRNVSNAFPSANSEIVGAILERQIASLEESIHKHGVRVIIRGLLVDLTSVYDDKTMPVRRARTLIKCMQLVWRDGDSIVASSLGFGVWDAENIGRDVMELLDSENLDKDARFAPYRSEYRATAHFWLALFAYRRLVIGTGTKYIVDIVHHVETACRILQSLVSQKSDLSPKTRRSSGLKERANVDAKPPVKTAQKSLVAPKAVVRNANARTIVRRAVVKKVDPSAAPVAKKFVTPRPRKALEDMSMNVEHIATPPKPKCEIKKPVVAFENIEQLFGLACMIGHLLGLTGLIPLKVKLLQTLHQIGGQYSAISKEAHVNALLELAHEYTKLGQMKRAGAVFTGLFKLAQANDVSPELRTKCLLEYAETLALSNNMLSSATAYCEALGLSDLCAVDEKNMPTAQRIRTRVARLERAAMACHVFAVIQYSKDNVVACIESLLQSLRLWNRSVDALSRLNTQPSMERPSAEENPFEVPSTKDTSSLAAGVELAKKSGSQRNSSRKVITDGTEWHIVEGLLSTLFALTQAYFARGSAREAEYFLQQAQDLAESMGAISMISRVYAKMAEVHIRQGSTDSAHEYLDRAAALLEHLPGVDAVNIRQLEAELSLRVGKETDAQRFYEEATEMFAELNKAFADLHKSDVRKSSVTLSPRSPQMASQETIFPALLAAILRQHIWIIRGDMDSAYQGLMKKLLALPASPDTKAEENGLIAKLSLHNIYNQFRTDLLLSSVTESTITLPAGMSGDNMMSFSPSTQEIVATLANAEKLFWTDISSKAKRGEVWHVRDAAVSLAMISALQASVGKPGKYAPVLAAHLLDASAAVTLHREMLEAIPYKFPHIRAADDMQWPLMTPNGSPLPRSKTTKRDNALTFDDDDDSDDVLEDCSIQQFWDFIQRKYESRNLDAASLSPSRVDTLPSNWTVVNISVSDDKSTMFICRQRASMEPLMFGIPLKGRRDAENDDDEQHLTYDDATNELKDIIALSDQGTRQAIHVKNDDSRARAAWWAERMSLDKRLQDLLENIEFCWLGAFKTILSSPSKIPSDVLVDLRTRLEKVFKRNLHAKERKQKTKVKLNDSLLECFGALSPKCRDEELEDLVYFILDLYQFHGVQVAISEVDMDQVLIDLRAALEEHATRRSEKVVPLEDDHMYLVLDKNVQGIPWESIPILRGRNISRIPSLDFLLDRVEFAKWQRTSHQKEESEAGKPVDRITVDPRKAYYVLNPSGDLKGTEGRFSSWLKEMHRVGWEGTLGRPPSEQQLLDALTKKDLVIYFGHGGGEQYVRSHRIRHLPRCAATMLWGCSSGMLKDMGDFDRSGTPYNYMLAGCPTLIANMWDVTDRDIDKFSQAVFDRLRLTEDGVRRFRTDASNGCSTSIVAAVAQSRNSCKLKFLTGAAPVVYGIPFYL